MKTKPIPGPFRAEKGMIKAVTHGEWYTVATVERKRFSSQGRVQIAEMLACACNSFDDMLKALKEIAKAEGPFSHDQREFAENVIETQQEIARAAIAKAGGDS